MSIALGGVLALCVAIALAYQGARIAAIDLDSRQRTMHRYFENRAETMRRRGISLPTTTFAAVLGKFLAAWPADWRLSPVLRASDWADMGSLAPWPWPLAAGAAAGLGLAGAAFLTMPTLGSKGPTAWYSIWSPSARS